MRSVLSVLMICALGFFISPAAHAKVSPKPITVATHSVESAFDNNAQDQFFLGSLKDYEDGASTLLSKKQFHASLILVNDRGVKALPVKDPKVTIAELFKENGSDLKNYTSEANSALLPDATFKNNETLFAFAVAQKSTFKTIDIPAPIIKVKSSFMKAGDKVVLKQGTPGKALKTTVREVNLATNKKINKTTPKGNKNTVVETVSVVKPPIEKSILVGTNSELSSEDSLPRINNLINPVPGSITSPYGMRVHPITHVFKLHDGTDFGAPCRTSIKATTGGKVISAEPKAGYGNQVIIDHGGGFMTSYSHMSTFSSKVGDVLAQGEEVGKVGATGYATGCHLHFMVYIHDKTINPIIILKSAS